jgi:hypothetical protein
VSFVSIGLAADHAAIAAAPCARLQDRPDPGHRVNGLSVQLRAARLSFWCPTARTAWRPGTSARRSSRCLPSRMTR